MRDRDDPRKMIIYGVQNWHDDYYNLRCGCLDRGWDPKLQEYVSQVCLDEADEMIAEIEDAAVRRYRGLSDDC